MSLLEKIYGSTGEIGKDGVLSPDQQLALERIQNKTAETLTIYSENPKPDEPFPAAAMATGIGKGRIIHLVIESQMRKVPHSRILVIAGTKNVLVSQTHQALSGYRSLSKTELEYSEAENTENETDETSDTGDYTPINSVLYTTGKLGQETANVHVTTIQGVQAALKLQLIDPSSYDLVVVDEMHNVGTEQRLEAIKQFKKVVGFTATPYRHSGKMKTPEQYGFTVIESLTLPEAQSEKLKLLPPLVGLQVDTKEVVDFIPTTPGGKIDFKALEKLLKNSPDLRPYIADRVAKIISGDGRSYKTIIAVNFIWEAQELAVLLSKKGIKVGIAVNSQAAKQIHKDEIPSLDSIERYKLPLTNEKAIQVLISPYVASEGFDAPFTEVLVWASPTDSALRYTQYTGRLARRAEGKKFGIIVDCLYQTNQYNWSYNMGMWMKGDVRQLENGLLWLGPESEIEGISKLLPIERLRKRSDFRRIVDLQETEILELHEGDFPISISHLISIFKGDIYKHLPKINQCFKAFKEEFPTYVVVRRSGMKTYEVIIQNADIFIKKVTAEGIKTKNSSMLSVQEGDFAITTLNIQSSFIGSISKVRQIFDEFKRDHPDYVTTREIKGRIVEVIHKELGLFFERVARRGIQIRQDQIPILQESDFAMTGLNVKSSFIGDLSVTLPIVKEVFEQFKSKFPENVAIRKNGVHIVEVVSSNSDIFIKRVVDAGVKQKEGELLPTQNDDFPITGANIANKFIFSNKGIMTKIRQLFEEFKTQYPECTTKRKNKSEIVDVICDKSDIFIEMIIIAGIKPRDERALPLQEGDFPLIETNIKKHFIGDENMLKRVEEIIEHFKDEFPNAFATRYNGSKTFPVIIHSIDVLFERIVNSGIRINGNYLPLQEGDFPIIVRNVSKHFVGNYSTLGPKIKKILEEFKLDFPESVMIRRNNTQVIDVVCDNIDIFIERVVASGIKLREQGKEGAD